MTDINNTSAAHNKSFDVPSLWTIGFRPILLFANHTPGIAWGADKGVYSDPLFCWSTSDKVLEDRRHSLPNVATMLGPTHIKDSETGQYYNLNVLDTDSVTVSNRLRVPIRTILDNSSYDWVNDRVRDLLTAFLNESGVVNGNYEDTLLDIFKKSGYVTKTKKEYGYHIYWLSKQRGRAIGTTDCLSDKAYELKTDDKNGLCTLPDSTHRDNLNFRYKAIGRTDVNLVSNILYDLFIEMFKDCLLDKKIDDTPKEEQKQEQTKSNRIVEIKNPIVLSLSIIQGTAGYMSAFIKKGYRHFFDSRFGGMMFHARISHQSAAQVIAALSVKISDEESESRLITLEDTYNKGFQGEEIQGGPSLAELIAVKVSGQDIASATLLIDNLKHMWRTDKKATQQRQEQTLVEKSIAEAKRMQSGYVKTRGTIMGMSTVYHMFKKSDTTCEACGYHEETEYSIPQYRPHVKPRSRCPAWTKSHAMGDTAVTEYDYIPTVDIWLQDMDRFNDLDRLQVKLFDNNTNDVNTGEVVDIVGHVHVVRNNDNVNSKPESVLFSDELIYTKRNEITLTQQDIDEIHQWKQEIKRQGKNVIDELASKMIPEVLGMDNVKKGLLIMDANAGLKNQEGEFPERQRIHTLLIGDPGTAKSSLAKKSITFVPRSQSVSGQAVSGVSLTAVINKENGGAMSLMLGPLALAKNAIGMINELGRLKLDQQPALFDVMEEGVINTVKYGFPSNVECHASVLATANPINSKWKNDNKVGSEEFPILLQVVDRFDLIFVVREIRDQNFLNGYVRTRRAVAENYSAGVYDEDKVFLQKYIALMRSLKTPKISHEADLLLDHFFKEMARKDVTGIFRKVESLYRVSIAIARLKLKEIVDTEDARETMQIFQFMLSEYNQSIGIPREPRDVVYELIRQIVKETYNISNGIEFIEAIKKACERDSLAMGYLGKDGKIEGGLLKQRHNYKLRPILELLRKDPYINIIGEHPIVLQWNPDGRLGDVSDVSDVDFPDPPNENGETENDFEEGDQKTTSPTSPASPRPKGIYKASWSGDVWTCRYCALNGSKSSMWKHNDCPELNREGEEAQH